MDAVLFTAPILEPVTLVEQKIHSKIDSETFDGNLTITQSLAFGSHIVADNYTTHIGTGIDVLGKQAIVELHCGTNGATGTNDTRIEESDQLATGYTAWATGAFTQVTTSNDNSDYKKQYTGTKRYIRTASKVLLAACEFGTSILVNAATTPEDDLLTSFIQTSREIVENEIRRALITQTWDLYLQGFPTKNYIKLPFGNLQTVTSIKYKDTAGTETTMVAGTDYLVETNGTKCGRIVLPDSVTWPTDSLYPSNPITIRFVCGWTTAALVPAAIKTAMKMICDDLYNNREAQALVGNLAQDYRINKVVAKMLFNQTLWEEL